MKVNQQILEGNWNDIKGRLQQRWGQLSGSELDQAHGDVDRLVGTIQRHTGEARENVEAYLEKLTSKGAASVSQAAEAVRHYSESASAAMRDASQRAAETVRSGYAQTERLVQERPVESLAVSFAAGLIAGVVVGLVMRSR